MLLVRSVSLFFFSSRRRHTRWPRDWSSDVCSSDLQHIQDDVRAELTTSITDAIDARTEQGEDPETAERAVLTELGDPAVLAAEYVDRPLHLIGPRSEERRVGKEGRARWVPCG